MDQSVLQALGLTPTGSVQMNTPTTGQAPVTTMQYDVGLLIPSGTQGSPPLVFPTIGVAATDLTAQGGLQALIGRDILDRCILIYNGTQEFFTLAY